MSDNFRNKADSLGFGIQGASSRHPLHFFIVSLFLLKGIKQGGGGTENLWFCHPGYFSDWPVMCGQ